MAIELFRPHRRSGVDRTRHYRGGILEFPTLAGPERPAEEESLNCNDIKRIDHTVAIHISSSPPASRWDKCDSMDLPLRGF